MIHKTLHRKQNFEQLEPPNNGDELTSEQKTLSLERAI
jgi:hypothetical protein